MIKKHFDKIIYVIVIIISSFFLYQTKIKEVKNQQYYIEEFEKTSEKERDKKPFSLSKKPVGILYVPKINLTIAVFDNSSETYITKGAGLIKGTGTLKNDCDNSVITSHNGDSLKDLFINIVKLKLKDKFYLKLSDKNIYEYEIIDIKEVSPINEHKEFLKPKEEETYVTLRTCTPIGINDKRFLATGKLIGKTDILPKGEFTLSPFEIGLIIILLVSLILLILQIRKEKEREKKDF